MATTYWGSQPELMEIVAMAQAGTIRSEVQRFDLDHAADAYAAMQAGTLTGRAVIVP